MSISASSTSSASRVGRSTGTSCSSSCGSAWVLRVSLVALVRLVVFCERARADLRALVRVALVEREWEDLCRLADDWLLLPLSLVSRAWTFVNEMLSKVRPANAILNSGNLVLLVTTVLLFSG